MISVLTLPFIDDYEDDFEDEGKQDTKRSSSSDDESKDKAPVSTKQDKVDEDSDMVDIL